MFRIGEDASGDAYFRDLIMTMTCTQDESDQESFGIDATENKLIVKKYDASSS